MKITNVEVLVLKSPGLYKRPESAEEPAGPTYMGLVRVSTDAGITGYSDMETSAPVAKAAVDAPSWSEPGMECFEGLASLIIGENPLEPERLLVQDVPRQHLLRPARRSHSSNLCHRYRSLGYRRQVLPPAGLCSVGSRWREQSSRLREHAVPAHARGHARRGEDVSGPEALRRSNSVGVFSAKIPSTTSDLVEAARAAMGR